MALILAGTPHPNDDGLLYNREPRRLWLNENSRPAWCLDNTARAMRDARRGQTVWIPRSPNSILEDGLLMVVALVLNTDEVKSELADALGYRELPSRIDLCTALTNGQYARLINLSRKVSFGWYLKLVIANFHGCTMINRLLALEHYGYDAEVLTPFYTRLYSRWLNATVIKGSLTDIPEITNRAVI